jgi:hypothetical protein
MQSVSSRRLTAQRVSFSHAIQRAFARLHLLLGHFGRLPDAGQSGHRQAPPGNDHLTTLLNRIDVA